MSEQISVQHFILIKDFLDDLVQKDLATRVYYSLDVRYALPHPDGDVDVILDDQQVHIMPPFNKRPEGFIAPSYVTYWGMNEALLEHYKGLDLLSIPQS